MEILLGSPVPHRPQMKKKPMRIVVLVSFIIMFLTCAYLYRLQNTTTCNMFYSKWCIDIDISFLAVSHIPVSVYIERGITLDMPQNPKIAFMFLTPGSLPFEKLWDNFFQVRIVCYLSNLFCILFIIIIIILNSMFELCNVNLHEESKKQRPASELLMLLSFLVGS